MTKPITGYAEGFYGRLLSWAERRQLLDALQRLGLSTYYYAPKEDPAHRLHWRTPYSMQWRLEFRAFCAQAQQQGVQVVAGVAPGLDFDFAHMPDGRDFLILVAKCRQLTDDGAHAISLLMDDIDADFDKRRGKFSLEGQAHAALANALGEALSLNENTPGLWVTPRIYADELISTTPDYLPSFIANLQSHHPVLYCGSDVVAHTIDSSSLNAVRLAGSADGVTNASTHRVIIWDNLYANDYCPRRLFVGPWQRRQALVDVLLNPTGMVFTDCLLLELMAQRLTMQTTDSTDDTTDEKVWQNVLSYHGVPDEFTALAPFFNHPVFNSVETDFPVMDGKAIRDSIEYCLWRWKTPLSREWYPSIFGLKHDLLALSGEHPPLRIRKTQHAPLAELLLREERRRD